MRKHQMGFGRVAAIVAAVVVLASASIGWYIWQTKQPASQPQQTTTSAQKTETKEITVNGHKLSYPLNDNNEQVIVEDRGNPYSPAITYAPVRNYFLTSTSEDCQKIVSGYLQADSLENLFGPSNPYGYVETLADKQMKVKSLIATDKAVKVGDIYVLAPSKQNEPCAEATSPKDGKLQISLFESQAIEKAWLGSLKLVQ